MLKLPGRLVSLGACLTAAANLVEAAGEEAAAVTGRTGLARSARELSEALGFGTKGARPRNAQAALRDLEDQQKARGKRLQRDALDRVLTELTSFYRDVLTVQTGAGSTLINAELAEPIAQQARAPHPRGGDGRRAGRDPRLSNGSGDQCRPAAGDGVPDAEPGRSPELCPTASPAGRVAQAGACSRCQHGRVTSVSQRRGLPP